MKLIGAISTAVLSLTLGVGIPAYAQQDQHDQQEEQKAKPAQDEKKAQPEKSAKPEEKNAQQDKNNAQEGKNAQQQDKNNKQEEKSAQQQDKNTKQEEKNAQQQDRNNLQEQRNAQQQHAGNNGGRIPDDRYKANFGQEHRFRVSQADYRDRRFQYGGYWFGFEGVWPSNWLYTQDVFVVEINGVYYLCNASYPGVNIALSVTL
jgi:DNA mismatch repair ATPase MutL